MTRAERPAPCHDAQNANDLCRRGERIRDARAVRIPASHSRDCGHRRAVDARPLALWQDARKLPPLSDDVRPGAPARRVGQTIASTSHASAHVLLWGLLPAVAVGILLGVLAGISARARGGCSGSLVHHARRRAAGRAVVDAGACGSGSARTSPPSAVAVIAVFPVANAVMMSLATRQGIAMLAARIVRAAALRASSAGAYLAAPSALADPMRHDRDCLIADAAPAPRLSSCNAVDRREHRSRPSDVRRRHPRWCSAWLIAVADPAARGAAASSSARLVSMFRPQFLDRHDPGSWPRRARIPC